MQCYFQEFERGEGIDKCLRGGVNMQKEQNYIKKILKKTKIFH